MRPQDICLEETFPFARKDMTHASVILLIQSDTKHVDLRREGSNDKIIQRLEIRLMSGVLD
jgi:hypothetical protein